MNALNADLDPLHRLIAAYAKPKDRGRYTWLFAFDSRLADIVRNSSEILIAQMKLTWWRDILTKPASQRPAGEPLIEKLGQLAIDENDIAALLRLIDGWENALEDFPWDERQHQNWAENRGVGFFLFGHRLLNNDQQILAQSWASWDFARHCSDENMREFTFTKARSALGHVSKAGFDRSGRPLSILCKLAERDVQNASLSPDLYRPGTAAQIIWHGITGM